MSLINQVLTDLDARRAGGGEAGKLPAGVRPVPTGAAGRERSRSIWFVAVLLGFGLAAAAAWVYLSNQPTRTVNAVEPHAASTPISTPSPVTAPETSVPPAVAPAPPQALAASAALADSEPAPPTPPAATAPDRVATPPRASEPSLRLAGRLSAEPSIPPELASPAVSTASPRQPGAASPRAEATANARVDKVAREADPAARARDRYQKALRDAAQGRQSAALAGMSEALAIDPAAGDIRQTLLRMLLEAGDHAAAEQVLADGLQLDPGRSDWALLLSRLQLERGDQAAASGLLAATATRQPGNAEVIAALGAVLHTLKRYAEAAQRYLRALEIDGDNGRYWLGLALAQDAAGASAEARQAFTRALDSGTLSPDLAAYARGRLR